MIGLVDCNNFYCSCERVFNPGLRTAPVVVLSNNDGCVIARSNEAKALDIRMGEPFYRIREQLERQHVAIFSSNYTLYGDMSRRVMMLLSEYTPTLTQYSIDEAFIDLSHVTSETLQEYGKNLVRTIGRGTGIPVTLGIAFTKTLAKVASRYGKRYKGYEGVCIIDTEDKRVKALKGFDIADVWGIGRRNAEKLSSHGIHTAWDLTLKPEKWVRKFLTITGVRTWKELQGVDCIDIDELPQKKSICTSRSFAGHGLSELGTLEEAVANFAASCSRKLKEQHSCCGSLTLFVSTSPFRNDLPSHLINRTANLITPTNSQQELVALAVRLLRDEWRKDQPFQYKKAGVIVWNITPDTAVQTHLFDPTDHAKQARLSEAIERINRKNGFNTVRIATQGFGTDWNLKQEYITHRYTTDINDILKVHTN